MLVVVLVVLLSSWSKYIAPILEPLVAWTPINTVFRRDYGAKVLGFDLSVNMIDIAQERLGPFSNISKIRFIALLLVVLKLFSIFLKIRLSKTWYGSWCEIRSSRRNPNWISKRNFWCHLLKVTHENVAGGLPPLFAVLLFRPRKPTKTVKPVSSVYYQYID